MKIKTIFISHGDKGGCGKSFLSTVIGSTLEFKEQKFLLVEADASEGGGQPDVAPRFLESKYAEVVKAPISGGAESVDLIAELFELIEQSDAEFVVINSPAGASQVLETVGQLITEACRQLDYRLVIFYNLFKTEVALAQAEKVINGDLVGGADEFYLVNNQFFGTPVLSGKLEQIPTLTLPVLHKNVVDRISSDTSFADAIDYLPTMQKIQLQQFFSKLMDQGLANVLFDDEG